MRFREGEGKGKEKGDKRRGKGSVRGRRWSVLEGPCRVRE